MRRLPALLATGLAVLAVGCGDDDDDDDAAVTQPPAATQTATPSADTGGAAADDDGDDAPAGGIDAVLRAARTAEGEVRGGTAYEVDADTAGGTAVLQVKVAVDGESREVTVSADGRDVSGTRTDRDDADDARDAADAQVDLADAVRAAESRGGSRTLDSVELDRDNGTLAYNVSFQGATDDDELEVVVDASSGDVLRADADD